MDRTLSDINHSNIFINSSPRKMEKQTKENKYDLLKSFCTAKKTINKMKRQPTDWEKIIINDVTSKGLVSKIHKQLMMLNSIKTNSPLKNWAEDLKIHFSKEDIQMSSRHMKRCSTSLVIREMQIKSTISPHISQNGYLQKIHKQQMLERVWRERSPPALFVGM